MNFVQHTDDTTTLPSTPFIAVPFITVALTSLGFSVVLFGLTQLGLSVYYSTLGSGLQTRVREGIVYDNTGASSYSIYVEYEANDGRVYLSAAPIFSKDGDPVTVFFNQSAPHKALAGSSLSLWILPFVIIFIGKCSFVAGLLGFMRVKREREAVQQRLADQALQLQQASQSREEEQE